MRCIRKIRGETENFRKSRLEMLIADSFGCAVNTLKDKIDAGGHTIGYYDALEWMACPTLARMFMARYMDEAKDFEVAPSKSAAPRRRRVMTCPSRGVLGMRVGVVIPWAATSNFMGTRREHLNLRAGEAETVLRGQALVRKWIQEPAVRRILQDLLSKRT